MADAGIRINGELYSIPQSLRLGELRGIKSITGLNPAQFVEAMNSLGETNDPDVLAAMVWWTMHREDPSFTVAMIDELEFSQIEAVNDPDQEPADPKAEGEQSASSLNSADGSSESRDVIGEPIHANGGTPPLAPFGQAT